MKIKDCDGKMEGLLEEYDNGTKSSGLALGRRRELKLNAWDGFGGGAGGVRTSAAKGAELGVWDWTESGERVMKGAERDWDWVDFTQGNEGQFRLKRWGVIGSCHVGLMPYQGVVSSSGSLQARSA